MCVDGIIADVECQDKAGGAKAKTIVILDPDMLVVKNTVHNLERPENSPLAQRCVRVCMCVGARVGTHEGTHLSHVLRGTCGFAFCGLVLCFLASNQL